MSSGPMPSPFVIRMLFSLLGLPLGALLFLLLSGLWRLLRPRLAPWSWTPEGWRMGFGFWLVVWFGGILVSLFRLIYGEAPFPDATLDASLLGFSSLAFATVLRDAWRSPQLWRSGPEMTKEDKARLDFIQALARCGVRHLPPGAQGCLAKAGLHRIGYPHPERWRQALEQDAMAVVPVRDAQGRPAGSFQAWFSYWDVPLPSLRPWARGALLPWTTLACSTYDCVARRSLQPVLSPGSIEPLHVLPSPRPTGIAMCFELPYETVNAMTEGELPELLRSQPKTLCFHLALTADLLDAFLAEEGHFEGQLGASGTYLERSADEAWEAFQALLASRTVGSSGEKPAAPEQCLPAKATAFLDWAILGVRFYYRDTELAVGCLQSYAPGQILRAAIYVDVTPIEGRPLRNCRYIIASAKAAPVFEFNPEGAPQEQHTLDRNACFKVLDVLREGEQTQVLLLHIPAMGIAFFRHLRAEIGDACVFETVIIQRARSAWARQKSLPPNPALEDPEWLDRLRLPIGLDPDGALTGLRPSEASVPLGDQLSAALRMLTQDNELNDWPVDPEWEGVDEEIGDGLPLGIRLAFDTALQNAGYSSIRAWLTLRRAIQVLFLHLDSSPELQALGEALGRSHGLLVWAYDLHTPDEKGHLRAFLERFAPRPWEGYLPRRRTHPSPGLLPSPAPPAREGAGLGPRLSCPGHHRHPDGPAARRPHRRGPPLVGSGGGAAAALRRRGSCPTRPERPGPPAGVRHGSDPEPAGGP